MAFTVLEGYIDPVAKAPLIRDDSGNLRQRGNSKILYQNHNGTYDFASNRDTEERKFFDGSYSKKNAFEWLSTETCREGWQREPGFEQLLTSVGDISGRKILLLGNGTSVKELFFLRLGAKCVYTDLSIEAIKYMKVRFARSELRRLGFDRIEFHAVDACQLPFPDNSFDIIYGCAFVHHIENLYGLFSEISRCLKPGGICRFLDHAYSPLWQFLKKTVLKPLQIYTHRKHGISPADSITTKRGGYKFEELQRLKKTHGFSEMLYLRTSFFEYLLQRGTSKLGGRCLRKLKPVMKGLDTFLDKTVNFVQREGLVLVWGFTK